VDRFVMNGNFADILNQLPANLASHVELVVVALGAGVLLSVPLALCVARRERLRYAVLTASGLVQTVPGLAMLALMVPLLHVTGGFGLGLSSFGFVPAVIALTLYSAQPILRNTVTGILGVDPALTEAARAVGMSPRQSLRQVELPLAAPVILAGIRTATVWTVSIATLATPVGQRSLGNFIFAGLQMRDWLMVMVGVVAAAGLAVVLDLLIGCLERGVAERRRGLARAAGGSLVLLLGIAMSSPRLFGPAKMTATASAQRQQGCDPAHLQPLRIGAKPFTEQYVLAALMSARLAADGVRTELVASLGSTVVFDALRSGAIGAYVDYSGTIWANLMRRSDPAPAWRVLAEVDGWLAREHGVRVLGGLGFENAYALAMRRDRAAELGITDVADLARSAGSLRIGADYEFLSRPEWQALRDSYGLHFSSERTFDPTLMFEALLRGEVDVIPAYTSDGRLSRRDVLLLGDPRRAIPPYHALLLVAPEIALCEQVTASLQPLIGKISPELMRQANKLVDQSEGKYSPEQAAQWLARELGLPNR
jgi:osmoprotectant transport system permease protein